MYSTARKLSSLSAIACAANIIGLILFLLVSANFSLNFAETFAIFTVLIASAATNLLLTLSLRSICQDLETEFEGTSTKLRDLGEHVKDLENK